MQITDEQLMAYADGELSPLEAKRIEAAMADDSALAARVARFRAVRRALRTAYDSVVSEPIPEHLRALLGDVAASEPMVDTLHEPSAPVADFAAARAKRAARFGPPAWAAMAASLLVGVIAGRALWPAQQDIFTSDGLYAAAPLAEVLNTRLAGDVANQNAATRIGLSFRTNEGDICRTFAHEARARVVSGLACRDENRWAVRMALTEPAPREGEFRQAGAAAPAVLEAVDAMIAGDPLDAAQERALRDNSWRSEAQR
jgi:negative regulator of sigma E activity